MAGLTGIFGGVFDPPHNGHVALARTAMAHFGLDRLRVLVVADPGHKRSRTPAETRLELARLAFSPLAGAEVVLDLHARTVDYLEEERPADALFLIGADELADFPRWKRPERVLELVRLGVATRPGVSEERLRDTLARLSSPERVVFFDLEPLPVSSSEIRARAARGETIDGLVPPAVAEAVARLGLYRGH